MHFQPFDETFGAYFLLYRAQTFQFAAITPNFLRVEISPHSVVVSYEFCFKWCTRIIKWYYIPSKAPHASGGKPQVLFKTNDNKI